MVEETVVKKSNNRSTAVAQVKALEERVKRLETYIKTFDMFLSNTMISNSADSSANETLTEMAAEIQ